ncbi:FAD-dependent monooxygenase [Reichenbachiella agarivorans]|uniref:FAD-dependent monooxygenase n=1 Tax=Reichenbachiella agarivorans TaxID=2979464 RepID=A0ABY6CT40_9BACT|nr:FAD-dependent monooxygenase [Reichenbachiella agarivorans]UXP32548.1 FAD-dependent monooxygenase [Reichenbachiella agarivorans]
MKDQYDVILMGGGLAGLTLSLQLRIDNPDISILILEQRKNEAPTAAHKVGESTVELGTYYLREVLGLKDYLDAEQLPKHGLRFYFSPKHKNKIEKRVELGPRNRLPVPSHQLDRGSFENELMRRSKEAGTDFLMGARVKSVEFGEELHTVTYINEGETKQVKARWTIDSTGRGAILKRQEDFQKPTDHNVNAVWFRVKGEIDVHEWSTDENWTNFLKPGLRRLGTVHLMDTGYWLWFIPLSSGNTSVGIVADPRFHDFSDFNTKDKAFEWIKKNEPQAFEKMGHKKDEILDFLQLKHYSHHSGKLYSDQRWAVTGDSGVFLDPLYSPGTDFISMNNTWITDLITRDLAGEPVFIHVDVYEKTHFGIFEHWIPTYLDKYQLMGNSQIMVAKIFWDWAVYWSFFTLLFTNKGYTNLRVLKALFANEDSLGRKVGILNKNVQDMFIAWRPHDTADVSERYVDPFDMACLRKFHHGLEVQYDTPSLLDKVTENIGIIEKLAAELFRHVSHKVHGTPIDMLVDPYTMDLNNVNTQPENGIPSDPDMRKDLATMWFYDVVEA